MLWQSFQRNILLWRSWENIFTFGLVNLKQDWTRKSFRVLWFWQCVSSSTHKKVKVFNNFPSVVLLNAKAEKKLCTIHWNRLHFSLLFAFHLSRTLLLTSSDNSLIIPKKSAFIRFWPSNVLLHQYTVCSAVNYHTIVHIWVQLQIHPLNRNNITLLIFLD